jgi:hypothetical protein
VYKILSSLGIKNIERLTDWREKDLLMTPDCGRRSLAEIKTMLIRNGLTLKEDYDIDEHDMNECSESIKSMTLRDYFAAKAMQAFLSSPNCPMQVEENELATQAYKVADAMTKAHK